MSPTGDRAFNPRATGSPSRHRPEHHAAPSEWEAALLGRGVAPGSVLWAELERERVGVRVERVVARKTEAA